jgi:hypothetical protein
MAIKPIPNTLPLSAPNGSLAEQFMLDTLLPPADTRRWVVRRKAAVVDAVRNGVITVDQACERYSLSSEEFANWQRLVERHGVHGLRVTRLQAYRNGKFAR